jgi:hypothetical protein
VHSDIHVTAPRHIQQLRLQGQHTLPPQQQQQDVLLAVCWSVRLWSCRGGSLGSWVIVECQQLLVLSRPVWCVVSLSLRVVCLLQQERFCVRLWDDSSSSCP